MSPSRRARLALATAPVQFAATIVLAAALWMFAGDDSGEWTGLIAVVIGIYGGPPLGLALMVGIVGRRGGHPLRYSFALGGLAALSSLATMTALLIVEVDVRLALGIVLLLSAVAVWMLSGHDEERRGTAEDSRRF